MTHDFQKVVQIGKNSIFRDLAREVGKKGNRECIKTCKKLIKTKKLPIVRKIRDDARIFLSILQYPHVNVHANEDAYVLLPFP